MITGDILSIARKNMAIAYRGKIGQQREIFCLEFIRRKKDSYRRIKGDIENQVKAKGELITCRKGCSACCVLYIEASIQEAEAIVYYLYHDYSRLAGFLERYSAWRNAMRSKGDPFKRCEQILHEQRNRELSAVDRRLLIDVLRTYHAQDIPCPFLEEDLCTIYEVRPYVCANHYVTTPSEWCRAVNWCNPSFPERPMIYMVDIDEIYDLSFYAQDLNRPVIGFAPTMVYCILTEGMAYVSKITGLSGLLPGGVE